MSDRAWLEVGGRVGVVNRHSASVQTIEKIGKRDVVLSDGQRFNVKTLRQTGASSWNTTFLTAPDDPRLLRELADSRRKNVAWNVERLMRDLRDGDESKAQEAVDLLLKYLGRNR